MICSLAINYCYLLFSCYFLTGVTYRKLFKTAICYAYILTYCVYSGTLIQELEATDADASSTLTYHIDGTSSPSSYNTFFAIEELNKLKLKSAIDLDVADPVDTFQLVVVVKDGGNPELSGTTTVLVTVAAVNENTPVFTGAPYGLDVSLQRSAIHTHSDLRF